MNFKFEKLIIWQKSMDYGEQIFQLTKFFPKEEMYNLTSQIRRAVDSIALNISEGAIVQSAPEFKNLWVTLYVRWLKQLRVCIRQEDGII